MSVGGETIYYPIVNAVSGTNWKGEYQAFFPVFKDIISITDYADAGTGAAVVYQDNGSSTVMPSGLSVVKGYNTLNQDKSGTYTGDENFANVSDSALTLSGPKKVFQWSASAEGSATPQYQNSVFSYNSPDGLNRSGNHYWIVQYSYKDNLGTTYYYYVGYLLKLGGSSDSGDGGCVTPDTLITLSDGTQKEIQHIKAGDQVLVWDFNTGNYVVKPVVSLINMGEGDYTLVELNFANGTTVKMLDVHGFFDITENKFVFIDASNVNEYVGHEFAFSNGTGFDAVTLESYSIRAERTTAYSILTHEHFNAFVEGMLSITPLPGIDNEKFYDSWVYGENMTYDETAMQQYIDEYGLYTYEDFEPYGITYEQFVAANLAYIKIAVGRGSIASEEVFEIMQGFVMPQCK
jgi:hypothetical protein